MTKYVFTEQEVKNLESFLIKHRVKIMELFDENSPNYIKRKSFVSERMRLRDSFEEYLEGITPSEKPEEKFSILQESKSEILLKEEFRSLSSETRSRILNELLSIIDDPQDEENNKIFDCDNPYWGSRVTDECNILTSFGNINFSFGDVIIATMNSLGGLGEYAEDFPEEVINFIKANRNGIYSIKFIIDNDSVKTFISKQSLIKKNVWQNQSDEWNIIPNVVHLYDKELYKFTESNLNYADICSLEGVEFLTDNQIILYEFIQTVLAKHFVSIKNWQDDEFTRSIKETIIGINPDINSWNEDNFALLKLSL